MTPAASVPRRGPDGCPDLGAWYDVDRDATTFAVWAPEAEGVEVCVLDDRGRQGRHPLLGERRGVWFGTVPGVRPGDRYGFRVVGPWVPERGLRFNPAKLLVDPYARAITSELVVDDTIFGYDLQRGDDTVRDQRDSALSVPWSVVVEPPGPGEAGYDARALGERPHVPWRDTVLYELHVRGYTMRHPRVPRRLRGTYAGLAHSAVLDDLVDLGVTTVELLPVHHFIDESWLPGRGLSNYWGYNTLGFFAPHARYSSAGTRGQQVSEFRRMVRAFHRAGLEVVLDVVFNHSCEQGEFGPTLAYRGIHNRGYYRLYDGGRRYIDITGTANTFDLTEPRVVAMVMDSLRYWVTRMGVDGFRFDLAPVLARTGVRGGDDIDMAAPLLTAIAQDPVLADVKLIAEPWDLGPNGFVLGQFPAPWAEWNGRYRDSVRDYWRGASANLADLGYRLSGSSDLFEVNGQRPFASINFVTCHDGFTLRDLVSYDRKHNEANGEDNRDGTDDNRSWNGGTEGETDSPTVNALRIRQAKNLLTTLILSVGTPMLLAGDELGRTQRGNNNAYCQDNEISWLDWSGVFADGRRSRSDDPLAATWASGLREHVRTLLRLRREHAVFRRSSFLRGERADGHRDVGWFRSDGTEMDEGAWQDPGRTVLGMFFVARDGSPDDSFLLWTNASARSVTVRLPGRSWALAYRMVLDTSGEIAAVTFAPESRFELPGRSAVLLRTDR